ncbi:MAG: GNAT family N-acetyltransferase [Propionibacteriaceae bacterium]
MADDHRVRPAVAADAAGVARVQTLGWQHGYAGLLPDDFLAGLDLEASRRRWRSQLTHADRTTSEFVLVDGSETVLAMMVVGPSTDPDRPTDGSLGHVYALYVVSERWGAGLGHALHERGMRALAESGYTEATLWVLEGNVRALRFYGRHGWTNDHLTKTEERPGASLVEHRLRLRLVDTESR